MALTANYIPKYKGLVSSHPQLEDSSLSDNGEILTAQGRAVGVTTETTTPYTVADTVEVVIVNAVAAFGGASFVVNLPVASGSGRIITVKNINTQAAEVTPNGTDTIDGGNFAAIIGNKETISVVDYAANKWVIV